MKAKEARTKQTNADLTYTKRQALVIVPLWLAVHGLGTPNNGLVFSLV